MFKEEDLFEVSDQFPKKQDNCKEIFKRHLNQKKKHKFHFSFNTLRLVKYNIIIVLLLISVITLCNIINNSTNNQSSGLTIPEKVIVDDPIVEGPSDEEKEKKIQELRKANYKEVNKDFSTLLLMNSLNSLPKEEIEILSEDLVIKDQNLSDVDYYYEVKIEYGISSHPDETIIVKKGELIFPAILNENGLFICENDGNYFLGWSLNGVLKNGQIAGFPIEKDSIVKACWVPLYTSSLNGITYRYYLNQNNEAIVVKGSFPSSMNNLVLSPTIDGYKITTIDSCAFGCIGPNIKNIVIPEGYVNLYGNAFQDYPLLESIVLPSTLDYLNSQTFSSSYNVRSITFPNGNDNYEVRDKCLIDIKKKAVIKGLGVINIPDDILYIESSAYRGMMSNSEIILPEGLIEIGSLAFCECATITTITFPSTLKKIGGSSFADCVKLGYIYIPKDLEDINTSAFVNINPSAVIEVSRSNKRYKSVDNNLIDRYEKTLMIGRGEIIPDEVTKIGKYAFYGCENIVNITLGSNIEVIGIGAFEKCINLKRVEISNNTKYIYASAFSGCTSLETVILPDEVELAGGLLFYNCSSLKSIKLPNNLTEIPFMAFSGCKSLTEFVLPSTVNKICSYAFTSTNIKYLDTSNVTTYENFCFYGMNAEEIVINQNITKINDFMFCCCFFLKELYIPENIKEIGRYAFDRCDQAYIYIASPKEEVKLGINYAGWDNEIKVYFDAKADNMVIQDGITYLKQNDNYIIIKCDTLNSILTIPAYINDLPVTKIANKAFYKNTTINKVVLPETIIEIEMSAFEGSSLKEINIPSSLKTLGSSVFLSCQLEEITIPENVTKVGKFLFQECHNLKSVYFMASIKTIPGQAFYNCFNLERVVYGEMIEEVEDFTYKNCDKLVYIEIQNPKIKLEKFRNYLVPTLKYLVLTDFTSLFVKIYRDEQRFTVFSNLAEAPSTWREEWFTKDDEQIIGYYFNNDWEIIDGIPTVK